MRIFYTSNSPIIGNPKNKSLIYDGELIPMKEVVATANGGIKIRLHSEDEFGNDSWTEIIFEPEEIELFRKTVLFNDPLL